MPAMMPVIIQECDLDDHEAALLWNWLLSRQGLAAHTKFGSLVEISNASLGLHAARLPSPYATALARAATPAVAASLFEPKTRADLLTVRCMRKTLHTLPLPLAACAHGATLHFRERDAQRAILNAGLTMSTISTTIGAITKLLDRNALHHRLIEERTISTRRSRVAVRLALKLAWERGILTYVNDSTSWNREYRTFAVTEKLHPELNLNLDQANAQKDLITTYFDRYGPATLKDAMWWSGLSRSAIVAAMNESGGEWVQVTTTWSPSPMYMYRARWEEFESCQGNQRGSGLNFLAHEDVALKAYFETRSRYLGTLHAREAFNQIGEVVPTILWDGQVVGTWSWQGVTEPIACSLSRGRTTSHQRRSVATQAETIKEALQQKWSNPAHPPTKNQMALL